MRLTLFLPIALVNLLLAGCGGQEPAPVAPAPQPVSSMPALDAAAAAPAVTAASGPAKAGAPPPPPAFDFASSKRELDRNGNPLSDLEMLNQLVMSYAGRSMSMAAEVKGNVNDPDAQVAAMSQQYLAQTRPLKSLSDLVTAGVIKSLPVPPAGKEYVLDPKTMTVAMTDKK